MQFHPWATAGTYYQALDCGINEMTTVSTVQGICACRGTLHSSFIAPNNAQTSGSWLIGTMVNTVASNISVVVDPTHRYVRDMEHRARVNPGDTLMTYGTPTGSATQRAYRGAIFFDSDNPKEQPLLGGYNQNQGTTTQYNNLQAIGNSWSGTETDRSQIIPANGKIKDLYVKIATAPGAGKTRTYTIMKNGVATSLEVALPNTTSGNDTNPDHAVSVVPGDTVSIRQYATAGTTVTAAQYWGSVWSPETDGEALSLSGTVADTLNPAAVEYFGLIGYSGANYVASVTDNLQGYRSNPPKLIVKNFYVQLSGAAGATGSDGYTIGVYDANSTVEHIPVTILGAATSGDSGTASGVMIPASASWEVALLTLRITPVGTPNAVTARFGHVRYLPPDSFNDYDLRPQLGGMGKNGGRIPHAKIGKMLNKTRIY